MLQNASSLAVTSGCVALCRSAWLSLGALLQLSALPFLTSGWWFVYIIPRRKEKKRSKTFANWISDASHKQHFKWLRASIVDPDEILQDGQSTAILL